jgi:hypothetical protein
VKKLLVLAACATASAWAQAANPDPQALIKMHDAWGPKTSTPGASIELREFTRVGPAIHYRLIAKGLDPGGLYTLVIWPVTRPGPGEAVKGVTLNAAGMAVCPGRPGTCGSPAKPDDPIDLPIQPTPGEPIRVGLVSADGKAKVLTKTIPVPLKGEDKGCTADATLLTAAAELVLIDGYGFTPNADVSMESDSEGERHTGTGKADSTGHYTVALLPYKKGLASGTVDVSLKSSQCAPSVKIPWGHRQ